MKRTTFNINFLVRKQKSLKDGKVPLYARITINGERLEFSAGTSISPGMWNPQYGQARGNSKEVREINEYLNHIRWRLMEIKIELENKGKDVSAVNVRNEYFGLSAEKKGILEIFKDHNENCKQLMNKDFAPGTVERYETCYRLLKIFILQKYRKEDVNVNDLNYQFIKDFEFYLKATRNCCHNTATKYIKNFKKIVRIAMANNWLKEDPFKNIKFRLDDVDMAFLNEEELNYVMNKNFSIARIQQVRDVYIFCCFTGLAFTDVQSLNEHDIVKEPDGSLWIKKKRQKTKNWCHIPLLPTAQKIIEKYNSNLYCKQKGVLLPVPSNQKMNAYLKEIADLCGISKDLSTHTARHTFATTVTLANKVSMEVVSKMLGHSSINMTKKYARIVDDLIKNDMQKLHIKYA